MTHLGTDLFSDVRHRAVDLVEKIGVVADGGRDGCVLGDQFLDVIGVAFGMDGDLGGDGVDPASVRLAAMRRKAAWTPATLERKRFRRM